MRDGPLRAAVKWVARLRFQADLAAVRALRRRRSAPWFVLGGECRRCDSYETRPGICRDYPRALLDQPVPALLPGCGYRAKAPDARRLLTVLDRHPLTEEQRARLKRDLRLE